MTVDEDFVDLCTRSANRGGLEEPLEVCGKGAEQNNVKKDENMCEKTRDADAEDFLRTDSEKLNEDEKQEILEFNAEEDYEPILLNERKKNLSALAEISRLRAELERKELAIIQLEDNLEEMTALRSSCGGEPFSSDFQVLLDNVYSGDESSCNDLKVLIKATEDSAKKGFCKMKEQFDELTAYNSELASEALELIKRHAEENEKLSVIVSQRQSYKEDFSRQIKEGYQLRKKAEDRLKTIEKELEESRFQTSRYKSKLSAIQVHRHEASRAKKASDERTIQQTQTEIKRLTKELVKAHKLIAEYEEKDPKKYIDDVMADKENFEGVSNTDEYRSFSAVLNNYRNKIHFLEKENKNLSISKANDIHARLELVRKCQNSDVHIKTLEKKITKLELNCERLTSNAELVKKALKKSFSQAQGRNSLDSNASSVEGEKKIPIEFKQDINLKATADGIKTGEEECQVQ